MGVPPPPDSPMPSSNNAKEPILPFGLDTTVESIKQKFPDPSVLPQLASQESWGVKQELGEESSRILAERDTSPASPNTFRSWLARTFGNDNPSPSDLVENVSRGDESAMRTSESRNRRSSETQRGGVTLLPELPAGMDPGKPDYDFGKEHQVWHDYSTGRVWKVTRNATFGKSENIRDYLTRLEAQNIAWKDDVRIEGVLPDGRMVTSQPFIEGRHPEDAKELGRFLEAAGWEQNRSRGTVWQAASGRIVMEDVHRHNFIVDGEGNLRAIDTNLVTQDEFLQYEDDEWVEPEDKMADLLDQGVLEKLFPPSAEATPEPEPEATPESPANPKPKNTPLA